MQIINNIEQGTPEWLQLRIGVFTATDCQAIANGSKGLETLILEKASENLTGISSDKIFENEDIKRGKELEPLARDLYEIERETEVDLVAFVKGDIEYTGCSPDGLISVNGLIEIKCPKNTNYLLICLNGIDEVDTKYLWQCEYQMFITGRKWVDLVFFNPNFKESLKIFRIERNENKQNLIKKNVELGIKKMLLIVNKIKNQNEKPF